MKPHHDYFKIWVATLETQNFNFSAYHMTEREARFALEQGLKAHGEQFQLDSDWWAIYEDSIYVREVELGHAYRLGGDQSIYAP
jgi:hypothetical protein